MTFDPSQSKFERNGAQISTFVRILEGSFSTSVSVVGIVEIGSFAKGEAIPASDSDTRVYIRCPEATFVNLISDPDGPPGLTEYLASDSGPEPIFLQWSTFNAPVRNRLREEIEGNISFGVLDVSLADFLFNHLEQFPTQDHSMLFQSNIVYDPHQWISRWRKQLEGQVFLSQVRLYIEQVLARARNGLPWYVANPGNPRGPQQWLLQAVRCIREAVSAQSYAQTGHFTFKKDTVLERLQQLSPSDVSLVNTLYEWKCDQLIRQEISRAFADGEDIWQDRFGVLTPKIQALVEQIVSQA